MSTMGSLRWVAVDTPGNFENGVRIFGSSGDDIVYARVAWQWPEQLEFSTTPPNMQSKLFAGSTSGAAAGRRVN
jgi:hypothetical protein